MEHLPSEEVCLLSTLKVLSFGISDSTHKEFFTVHPTGVTCSVDFNELSTDFCNYLKNVTIYVQDQIATHFKVQEGTVHLTQHKISFS